MHFVHITVSGAKSPMAPKQEWWVLAQLLEKAVNTTQQLQQLG